MFSKSKQTKKKKANFFTLFIKSETAAVWTFIPYHIKPGLKLHKLKVTKLNDNISHESKYEILSTLLQFYCAHIVVFCHVVLLWFCVYTPAAHCYGNPGWTHQSARYNSARTRSEENHTGGTWGVIQERKGKNTWQVVLCTPGVYSFFSYRQIFTDFQGISDPPPPIDRYLRRIYLL